MAQSDPPPQPLSVRENQANHAARFAGEARTDTTDEAWSGELTPMSVLRHDEDVSDAPTVISDGPDELPDLSDLMGPKPKPKPPPEAPAEPSIGPVASPPSPVDPGAPTLPPSARAPTRPGAAPTLPASEVKSVPPGAAATFPPTEAESEAPAGAPTLPPSTGAPASPGVGPTLAPEEWEGTSSDATVPPAAPVQEAVTPSGGGVASPLMLGVGAVALLGVGLVLGVVLTLLATSLMWAAS